MKEMSEYALTTFAVALYAVTVSIVARTVKVLAATRQRSLAGAGILAVPENLHPEGGNRFPSKRTNHP